MRKKSKMRTDKKTLNLRAMGISNWAYDEKNHRGNSIQFYDYDFNGETYLSTEVFLRILEIFPYDCLMYETKHGVHFISFALLKGYRRTKSRAVETSKDLGHQDYWTEAKDLTLRISAKWKKKHRTVSEKPKFLGVIKHPKKFIISQKHLNFYKTYMELPQKVFDLYSACDKRNYKIKIYHYKTRD